MDSLCGLLWESPIFLRLNLRLKVIELPCADHAPVAVWATVFARVFIRFVTLLDRWDQCRL